MSLAWALIGEIERCKRDVVGPAISALTRSVIVADGAIALTRTLCGT
jgi:hypothetical protein